MEQQNVMSFLIAVTANVISYLICKWLDSNGSDN